LNNRLTQSERTDSKEDTSFMPMVTIITPVLNGVRYLELCVESVLKQRYPHIEHVFIDGVSTDGTVGLLTALSRKYPEKIRFISEPDNGAYDADNKGIVMACGEIIGFLGVDDTYEPGAIQAVAQYFADHPDVFIVYGDNNCIDANGEFIICSRSEEFDLKKTIHGSVGAPGASIFYRKEIFNKIGVFDQLVSDLDFIIRAGKVVKIHRLDRILCNNRIHKGSITWGSWEGRKKQMRNHCIVSRRHGGGIFSGYCRIYYSYVLLDWFRPVFGPIYPFIGRLTGKNIGKTKDDWAIRIKG